MLPAKQQINRHHDGNHQVHDGRADGKKAVRHCGHRGEQIRPNPRHQRGLGGLNHLHHSGRGFIVRLQIAVEPVQLRLQHLRQIPHQPADAVHQLRQNQGAEQHQHPQGQKHRDQHAHRPGEPGQPFHPLDLSLQSLLHRAQHIGQHNPRQQRLQRRQNHCPEIQNLLKPEQQKEKSYRGRKAGKNHDALLPVVSILILVHCALLPYGRPF